MNIKEIVTEYLKSHGFDGLYHDDCGCDLQDLMPCDEPNLNCRAVGQSSGGTAIP